ncbi:sulfotransferase domain-containing protein [Alicyclobacillus acidiphilus]|uniref:sulfotransferase domain-containing protein n=1 Tax=Alicyclobacillus acidiphilus TaxID=182455 RepID=UPI0008314B35|nr:sulfotransferase domain-containing protein [Alicyclobacillus acidiphilus]
MMQSLPRVLVLSVPKGGTNLLMQVVMGIPGMQQIRENMMTESASGPIGRGEMGVMHLPYHPRFEKLLVDHGLKAIFITRDPRDIVVSLMYFILHSLPSHILHLPFKMSFTTNEQRLQAIINGVSFQDELADTVLANELVVAHGGNRYPNIDEFIRSFLPWRDSPCVCHVRYEDLVTSPKNVEAVRKIVDFLWDDVSALGIPKELLVSQMIGNINPSRSPTFRAGRTGDWRFEFSEQNKEDFKRVAGARLIELGYESDLSW